MSSSPSSQFFFPRFFLSGRNRFVASISCTLPRGTGLIRVTQSPSSVPPSYDARYGGAPIMNPHGHPVTNGASAPGPRVKVFDFFSGCGGASRGFQDAGMDIVFGLDWDGDAERTFKLNFPAATFEAGDIRLVKVRGPPLRSLRSLRRVPECAIFNAH